MDIKNILKYFVYFFIVFCITIVIINNVFPVKEGFDIVQYIQQNPDKRRYFYTEAEAGAVDFGITTAVTAVDVTLLALGIYLVTLLCIPIIGWIMAIGVISAITASLITKAILLGQWVKPNDPKSVEAANLEICAIQTEINACESEISEMNLQFDKLKYAFKANQVHIKTEAKKILKRLDDTTELIHDMYFPYLTDPSSNIPIIKFYHECKEARINLLTISNEHTLRKDLDIKSSDIDITLLDNQSFKYYIKQANVNQKNIPNARKKNELNCSKAGDPNAPPKKGDIKADITDYIIIVTYTVGDSVNNIKTFVDQQIQNHPDSKKKKKHSITEHNRKKMSHLFKQMKPILEKLYEHIQLMKITISANAKIYERRDELRAIIAADKVLIKEIKAYMIPHFYT